MARHEATIRWDRNGDPDFLRNRYSRVHRWLFDGGVEVRASSSPSVVPVPLSAADAVDPEEALVASASSCHMLFFLHLAAKGGFIVDSYSDAAQGEMLPNAAGKLAMARIILSPRVVFSGTQQPTLEEIERLHEQAHSNCYIASSLRAEVSWRVAACERQT